MPPIKPRTSPPIHGVAVDQGSGLGAAIKKARGAEALDSDLFEFKRAVVEALSPSASMLLVDAEYGSRLLPHFDKTCGQVLAYEADVYHISDEDRITVLPSDLTISDYRSLGVRRLKFFLYYAPRSDGEINERKRALVRDLGASCAEHGLEFLFEPLVYDEEVTAVDTPEFARLKPGLVEMATATFAQPEFGVDILKVEIPVTLGHVEGFGGNAMSRDDALRALQVAAAAAGSIPLVYLSAGVSFDQFEKSLWLAREAGVQAAGFMCGRAIWSDAVQAFGRGGPESLQSWLLSEGRTRLERLKAAL